MPRPRRFGRTLPLSLPRLFVADLLHFAQRTPTVTARRTMPLADLAAARLASCPRVGWTALFLKAYALVAAARPELRRCYLGWPRPRLYEHYESVATVAVERRYAGEDAVFVAFRSHPERLSLVGLDAWVRGLKTTPVEAVPSFRRVLRVTRLPRPLRRLVWWTAWAAHGRWHAKYLGTFGLSAVAAHGASLPNLLSPLTTTLSYGPLHPDGTLAVTLTFDHRVLDGGPAARALADLEATLTGPVLAELRGGSHPAARAA
jgi:hypothetical protein